MATHNHCDSLMRRLASLGEERQRRMLVRQGATATAFGVPYAALYKLERELGIDQSLAESLWQTGNHDARVLATLIADPEKISASILDRWAKTIDNELMLQAVAGVAARTAHGRSRAEKWIETKSEWLAAAGWQLIGALAASSEGPFEEGDALAYLERIESEIAGERNRVKHSMNFTLIAMSARSPATRKKCIAAAKRIGTVEVDHGVTSCKTPRAVPYIEKMATRAAAKKARKVKRAAKKAE